MTNYKLTIEQDDHHETLEEIRENQIGTLVTTDNRYFAGEEVVDHFFGEYLIEVAREHDDSLDDKLDEYRNGCGEIFYEGHREDLDEIVYDSLEKHKVLVVPVYAYIHSGIALSTGSFSCPWDSGQIGIVVVTQDDLKKLGLEDKTEKEIEGYVKNDIEYINNVLNGNMWYFNVEKIEQCNSCGNEQGEIEDSCGGFVGDDLENTGLLDVVSDYGFTKEQIEKAWEDRF